MDAMDAIVLEPGAGRALAVGPVGLSVKEDETHHAPPRFPGSPDKLVKEN